MKVAIIGPLSFPSLHELKKFEQSVNENIKNFHPHPWIYNLSISLSEIDNLEVHVISTTSNADKSFNFKHKNVHFHVVRHKSNLTDYLTLHLVPIIKIIKLLKEISPDIVHGQSRSFESVAAIFFSNRHVVTNHGDLKRHRRSLFPSFKCQNFLNSRYYTLSYYILLQLIVYRLTKNEIIVSNSCKDSGKLNSHLIFNPISDVFFQYNWQYKVTKKILFTGSLTKLKRPHLLLEYLISNNDVSLVIVSQFVFDDDYCKGIQSYIDQNNLKERVSFISYCTPDSLARIMSESSLLCLPSTYESFGMVIAESLAVGCPVVASKVGGIVDIVNNKETGLLFDVDDKNDLFDKLNILLSDNKMAESMSVNGKKFARQFFKSSEVAKQTFKLYQEVFKAGVL